mmetsp:Transcript_47640/g.120095  ORF Transcript_47640/g.120095 Transcript_47640/m.120095 type:complete len:256 (-) Transcript_47640:180-947(-)
MPDFPNRGPTNDSSSSTTAPSSRGHMSCTARRQSDPRNSIVELLEMALSRNMLPLTLAFADATAKPWAVTSTAATCAASAANCASRAARSICAFAKSACCGTMTLAPALLACPSAGKSSAGGLASSSARLPSPTCFALSLTTTSALGSLTVSSGTVDMPFSSFGKPSTVRLPTDSCAEGAVAAAVAGREDAAAGFGTSRCAGSKTSAGFGSSFGAGVASPAARRSCSCSTALYNLLIWSFLKPASSSKYDRTLRS